MNTPSLNAIIVKIQKHLCAVYGGETADVAKIVNAVHQTIKAMPAGNHKVILMTESTEQIIAKYNN